MNQTETETESPPDPAVGKAANAPTSPLSDTDLDGPGDAARATLVDGLVFCPHCQGWVEPDPVHSGRIVACPHCEGPFRMPETFTPTFAPAPLYRPGSGFALKEPWFYVFIDTYAKVWLWLSLFVFGLVTLGVISLLLPHTAVLKSDPWISLALGALIVGTVPGLLGILLTVAFMHLAVDIARNLRALRQHEAERGR